MTITKTAEPVVNVNDVSRISAGTKISGEMSAQTDVRVDGTVEGTLYSKGRIVVGENASLKGVVMGTDVDLWGKLEGDVYVKNLLSLKASSSVTGNIYVRKLSVEMGAQINGSCHMISEADYDKQTGKKQEAPSSKAPATPSSDK